VATSVRRHRASGPSGAPPAVWFFPSDYAGFWRRVAVALVDATVIVLLLLVVTVTVALLDPTGSVSDVPLVAGWAALIYGYFVLLKRSRFRTAGYRLAGVRIVDAGGHAPGLGALSVRLGFGVLGPLNLVLDALWIPFDRRKQALRDKVARTYVVRTNARPAGPARVVLRSYHVMGMVWVFEEVESLSLGGVER
jgi:uncharacterized RDD family membrane protein YckC